MSAVAVLSGGLDSTTAMYKAVKTEALHVVRAVSFDYGQRHRVELQAAEAVADVLGVPHSVIDLRTVTHLIRSSVLTNDELDVPEGHYTHENMSQTVVPNRNMMMASIAAAIAISQGANTLVLGVHAGDHAIYPDCRPAFWQEFRYAVTVGNQGFIKGNSFNLYTPFIELSKADIVWEGLEVGVPFALTHTCYKGRRPHCGRCATCVERLEAFYIAGVEDPMEYEDRTYWKQVCNVQDQ